MNRMFTIIAVLAFDAAVAGSTYAQRPHGGPWGGGNADAAVKHLTEAFSKIVAYDVNKDGQLDGTELTQLQTDMNSGKVRAPEHRGPPSGVSPDQASLLTRLAAMYARVAVYDADKNGQLDATEQAALKKDIEAGKLPRGGDFPGRPAAE